MALQGPFFGKREPEPAAARGITPAAAGGGSSLGSVGSSGSAQPFSAAPVAASAPVMAPAAAPAAATDSGAKLTVGPNIKLKGVEITDCDTLVVEGTVEATMNSRVLQIAEHGAVKGSAVIDIGEVRGVFEGDLTVREKLVVFATGKVTGTVRYGKIVIEEGGQISGDITFGTTAGSASANGVKGA